MVVCFPVRLKPRLLSLTVYYGGGRGLERPLRFPTLRSLSTDLFTVLRNTSSLFKAFFFFTLVMGKEVYYKVCTISDVNLETASPPLCPSLSHLRTCRDFSFLACSQGGGPSGLLFLCQGLLVVSQWRLRVFSLMSVSFTILSFSSAYFCSPGSGEIAFKACMVTLKSDIDKTCTMCQGVKHHRILESTGMLGRAVFLEHSHSKSFSCN